MGLYNARAEASIVAHGAGIRAVGLVPRRVMMQSCADALFLRIRSRASLAALACGALVACGGSSPVAAVDGGASLDGGASVDGGPAQDGGADAGPAEVLTYEALGRLAYDTLKRSSFSDFYTRVVAARDDVKASCPGISVDARYAAGGDLSQGVLMGSFNDCKARINNIAQTDLVAVRVAPLVAALVPPACNAPVPRARITVEMRSRAGTSFYFTMAEAMTFATGARLLGGLRDCGSATVLSDGGTPAPLLAITTSPASPRAGDPVAFTANISSGTPPYTSCTWRYIAGDNPVAGALAGSTCTGSYTYPQAGEWVASVEVGDSGGRAGTKAQSLTVTSNGMEGPPDLIIRSDSLRTVDAPAQNRYRRGAVVTVDFIAKNIGAGAAAATTVRVLLRDPVGRSQTPLGNVDIAALMPGQELPVRRAFQIAANQQPLVYDLVANINPDRTVVDANLSNNEVTFLWVEVIQ